MFMVVENVLGFIVATVVFLVVFGPDAFVTMFKGMKRAFIEIADTLKVMLGLYYDVDEVAVIPEEYVEYETPSGLARIWYDHKAIGLCKECGMDDAPVLRNIFNDSQRCKWCVELTCLKQHREIYSRKVA